MQYSSKLSVCTVTYNSQDKIGTAVASIKKHTKGVDYKYFIFDNGSTDNTKQVALSADENVIFHENGKNLGFGKANNLILPIMDSKYLAIVNPDIKVDSDVLSELCLYLDTHDDVSMATPKILFPDGKEQILPKRKPKLSYLLGRRLPILKKRVKEYTMEDFCIKEPLEVEFITGCFVVIRAEVFKKLSGFDDRFFMYFEDADLTLRAKEYGKTVFLPQFHVIHEWERSSAKSFKYLMIHISSMFKFLWKHRKYKSEVKKK